MKKTIISFFGLLALMLLQACNIETSDNGHLDGFWQLKQIDNLVDNTSADKRYSSTSWSFQGKLVNLRSVETTVIVVGNFTHENGTLRLSPLYVEDRISEEGDHLIVAGDADYGLECLLPFGFSEVDEVFQVEVLTSSTMVLSSPARRLYFRKY